MTVRLDRARKKSLKGIPGVLGYDAFLGGDEFRLLLESHITMMRCASWGALVGIVPPILVMAMTHFQGGVFQWPTLAVTLWPTSIMLMGTMGQELTVWGIVILVLSVLLNQIVYGVTGLLACLLRQRVMG